MAPQEEWQIGGRMAAVDWRLFSLSIVAAILGAQAAFAQSSYPCVNDAPDPYQRGASFAASMSMLCKCLFRCLEIEVRSALPPEFFSAPHNPQ